MQKYDIAAYVWPAYTGDETRTRIFWQDGIGEWQTVRDSKMMPPLWGFVNEADPAVMEKEIETATNYGVNVFIYDWYWYDGRPFLENCLNDGFLKAKNHECGQTTMRPRAGTGGHTISARRLYGREA